jgi:hypothetical protein
MALASTGRFKVLVFKTLTGSQVPDSIKMPKSIGKFDPCFFTLFKISCNYYILFTTDSVSKPEWQKKAAFLI